MQSFEVGDHVRVERHGELAVDATIERVIVPAEGESKAGRLYDVLCSDGSLEERVPASRLGLVTSLVDEQAKESDLRPVFAQAEPLKVRQRAMWPCALDLWDIVPCLRAALHGRRGSAETW